MPDMNKKTILVVDDDHEIVRTITITLEREGYHVLNAYDGLQALDCVTFREVHLIIIDVMMPKLDGLSAVMKIREKKNLPIIILSAKGEDSDKILGLSMGADDYIVKPFEVVELLARVDVVLRRYNKTDAVIDIGGLRIDTRAMQVWRGTEEISLTHKEYDLLLFFARNPGTALYRETIYEHVWGGEYSYGSKTVDLHIQRLRKKVGWEKALITIPKVGYRLVDTT